MLIQIRSGMSKICRGLLLLCVMAGASCATNGGQQTSDDGIEVQSYASPNDDYKLDYPKSISIEQIGDDWVSFKGSLHGPRASSAQAELSIWTVDGGIGVAQGQELDDFMNGFAKDEWGRNTLDGAEAALIDSTTSSDYSGNRRMLWVLHEGKTYIFDLSFVADEYPEAQQESQELWQIITGTFRFIR